MRDNAWLKFKLELVEERYFPEVAAEEVKICFSGRSRQRLGSIRHEGERSKIKVNALLSRESIPEFVIEEVIAHELVHYVHGFGSNRPRLHKYPHRGGVVDQEMSERGAGHLIVATKEWLENNWETA